MSREKAPYTNLLQEDKKTNLTSLDLFDRVINLKLTVSSKDANGNNIPKQEYVIRSDYEMYYPELLNSVTNNDYSVFKTLSKCQIRKCQYKPDIKIQYKRVAMDVPEAVDIYIKNFYMLDKSGKMIKSFNNVTNALTKVEIAMGYFGQFEETLKATLGNISIKSLFDFSEKNLSGKGISVITLSNVEYVQTDTLPPDMTVHIHGYVGNYYASDLQNLELEKSLPEDYLMLKTKGLLIDTSKGSSIVEKTFFDCVTKNYLKQGSLDKITQAKIKISSDYLLKGQLSDTYAKQYGVQVLLSKKAKEYAKQYEEEKVLTDKNGKKTQPKFTIEKADNAMQKASLVKNVLGMQDYCITDIGLTGDLFVYHKEEVEDVKGMLQGTDLEKQYKKDTVALYWKNKLPAVYNITTDAICTISCPFFFFLNPFEVFYFKSRYTLSGLVSYYANFNATENKFYALWQNISFATVEDINECLIACTGEEKEGLI